MLKKKLTKGVFVITIFLLIFTSCSKYQRLLKSDDVMLKKEKAIEYYYNEDYHRALGLLTDVIPAFRGTAQAETLNYYYAMAHYKQGDYILAAHYFRTFTQGFPRSEHAEEFLFMSAYCKYLLSPRPSLDQTPTREAIRELQAFTNRYPNSHRVEEANKLIDELRGKLEVKAFETAMLYYNLRDYTAAVTSFRNVIRDFPDTEYREEAMYYIIRSHFLFAENSIQIRQLERYRNVVDAHRRFANRFPDSELLTSANRMLSTSLTKIDELEEIAAAQAQSEN
ncbi:MAG: outer membrane protein assembly factor BamD [Bacteroidetes bacterium]|nr:MAG: outer membrane protein assembly factor BamD [Bacteroidota bacterium]